MHFHLKLVIVAVTAAASYVVPIDDAFAQAKRSGTNAGVSSGSSGNGSFLGNSGNSGGGRTIERSRRDEATSSGSGRKESSSGNGSSSAKKYVGDSDVKKLNSSGYNTNRADNKKASSGSDSSKTVVSAGKNKVTSPSKVVAGNKGPSGRAVDKTTTSNNSGSGNNKTSSSNATGKIAAGAGAIGNKSAAVVNGTRGKPVLSPAQRSSLGAPLPRPNTGIVKNNTLPGSGLLGKNGQPLKGDAAVNGVPALKGVPLVKGAPTPVAKIAAPGANVRAISNVLPSTLALPTRLTVAATVAKLGRIAPPANVVAKTTLVAPVLAFKSDRFRPFLQRHWRSAFFWIAIPTIGFVTIPEHAYERFKTFVSRPEPDYDGAVKYLSRVAAQEDHAHVPRVPHTNIAPVKHTVAVAPAPVHDARFTPFVNRKWNADFVTIAVPRIGNVTCPAALLPQVQPLLAMDPPLYEEALELIEEAAAADTIVEEGALADASIETVQ